MANPSTIRSLFSRELNRPIEKVITYQNQGEAQLKTEISEYVVTDHIADILHPHWRSRVSHLGPRKIERVRDCRERILRYPIHLMFVQAKIGGIRETFL